MNVNGQHTIMSLYLITSTPCDCVLCRMLWLLAVPMYNFVVSKVQGLLGRGQGEEEEEVVEDAGDEDMALLNEGM